MRKGVAGLILVVLAGCASAKKADEPLVGAPIATTAGGQSDAKLEQLQTSMTELLERLDVLNDRISKLEASGLAAPAAHAAMAAPAPRPAESSPLAAAAETRAGTPESRAAAVASVEPAPVPPPSKALAGARTAEMYRSALMQVGQGKLAEARKIFQQVFDAEPTGDLADNAMFWIGETYYSAGEYATAMRYYRRVTTEFAEQNKAPDALLKTALCYEKTSDLAMARQTLEEVIQ